MSLPSLSGKGLFVFSDPGGAKPVLAMAQQLKDSLDDIRIISDRKYSFYSDFSVEVCLSSSKAEEAIHSFNPAFILTGTSYTSTLELEYIKVAHRLSLPVYSFVDHWTRIRDRFQLECNEYLPDLLLLVDERAKSIAIESGIDERRIQVIGNPYHSFLRDWKPRISRPEFYRQLGLSDLDKGIVLYAPDPLTNVDGINQYGFDEVSATGELSSRLGGTYGGYYVLLKPHPNQVIERLRSVVGNRIVILPSETDINTLIFYSSVVVGFFSSLLIEAAVMNRPVIRFFPGGGFIDPLEESGIGQVVYPVFIAKKIESFI